MQFRLAMYVLEADGNSNGKALHGRIIHTDLTENAGQSTGADEEAGEVGETEEEKVDRMLEELGFTFTLKLLGGSEQSSKVIFELQRTLTYPPHTHTP
jgi:hypothetical protein